MFRLFFIIYLFISISNNYGDEKTELINEYCPVISGETTQKKYYYDYQNKRIYFCCSGCIKRFVKKPEYYMQNLNGGQFPTLKFIGKLHSIFIHFPIALLVVVVVMEFLQFLRKNSLYGEVARIMLVLAALGGIAAAFCGWANAEYTAFKANYFEHLEQHRILGISASIAIALACVLGELKYRKDNGIYKKFYLLLLAVSFVLIVLTGFFGGAMWRGGVDYYLG